MIVVFCVWRVVFGVVGCVVFGVYYLLCVVLSCCVLVCCFVGLVGNWCCGVWCLVLGV